MICTLKDIKPGDVFITRYADGTTDTWFASNDGAREELRVKMLITKLSDDFMTCGIGYLENQSGIEVDLKFNVSSMKDMFSFKFTEEKKETPKSEPVPIERVQDVKSKMIEYREIDNVLCSDKSYRTLVIPGPSNLNTRDIEASNQLMAKWFLWVKHGFPMVNYIRDSDSSNKKVICIPPDVEMFKMLPCAGKYNYKFEKIDGCPMVAQEAVIDACVVDKYKHVFINLKSFDGFFSIWCRRKDFYDIYTDDDAIKLEDKQWCIYKDTPVYTEHTYRTRGIISLKGYHSKEGRVTEKNYPVIIKETFIANEWYPANNTQEIQAFALVETIMNGRFSTHRFIVKLLDLRESTAEFERDHLLNLVKDEAHRLQRKIDRLHDKGFIFNPTTDDVVILPAGKMMILKLRDNQSEYDTVYGDKCTSMHIRPLYVIERIEKKNSDGDQCIYKARLMNTDKKKICAVDLHDLERTSVSPVLRSYKIRKNSKLYRYDKEKRIMNYNTHTNKDESFNCEILEYKMARISDTFDAFVRIKIEGSNFSQYWTKFDFLEEQPATPSLELERKFISFRDMGIPVDVCNDYVIPMPAGTARYTYEWITDENGSEKYCMTSDGMTAKFQAMRLLKRKITNEQCFGLCVPMHNKEEYAKVWYNLTYLQKKYEPLANVKPVFERRFQFLLSTIVCYKPDPNNSEFKIGPLKKVDTTVTDIEIVATCIGNPSTPLPNDPQVFVKIVSKDLGEYDFFKEYWVNFADLTEVE